MFYFGKSFLFLIFLCIICYSQDLQRKGSFVKSQDEFYMEYLKARQKLDRERIEFLVKAYPNWTEELIKKLLVSYLSFYNQRKLDLAGNYIDIAKEIAEQYKKICSKNLMLKQAYFYENLSDDDKNRAFRAITIAYRAKISQDAIYLFSIESSYEESLNNSQINESMRQRWHKENHPLSSEAFISEKTKGQEWAIQDSQEEIPKKYLLLKTQKEIAVYNIDLYKEAMSLLQKIGDYFLFGFVANRLGEQFYTQGQTSDAQTHFLLALDAFERIQDDYSIAKTMVFLGMLSFMKKDYALASSYYERSHTILQKSQDRESLAFLLSNMGALAKEQGKYSQAKECFERSLEIYFLLEDKKKQADALSNLGHIAYIEKEYKKAVKYLEQSSHLARDLKNEYDLMSSLDLLANINTAMGEYQKTQLYLEEKLGIANKRNNTSVVLDALCDLAKAAILQGKREKAKEYYQKKMLILKCTGNTKESKEMEEKIFQLELQQRLEYLAWGIGIVAVFFALKKTYSRIVCGQKR